jgi:adenosylhomocysteine nucleosidase
MDELFLFANARGLLQVGGVGATAAEGASAALLAAGAQALVSWGSAAGVTAAATAGTVVIATRVVTFRGPQWTTTQAWSDAIARSLDGAVPVMRGGIACPSEILRTPAEKGALAEEWGDVVAADMESAAVARAAERAGVPWTVVRAVADTVDTAVSETVSAAIDASGRVSMLRLFGALLRRPQDIALLPPLARAFNAALAALRIAADRAGPVLLDPPEKSAVQ